MSRVIAECSAKKVAKVAVGSSKYLVTSDPASMVELVELFIADFRNF